MTRGLQEGFTGLVSAVGSVSFARREKRTKHVQLVSWAGRAETDTWFRAQLEQSKNQALIYYVKNQIR